MNSISRLGLSLLAVLLTLTVATSAHAYPAITHPVTDLAGVLTPAEVEDIAARELDHFQRTHVQIAVLTVPTTNGEPIEDFTNGVAGQWRGGQAGQNNGVLVVLAIQDHRSRIEVGSGLEAQVTDSQAVELLDSMRPSFRASQFGDGLRGIVGALIVATGGNPQMITQAGWSYHPMPAQHSGDHTVLILLIILGGFLFLLMLWWMARDNGGRRGYSGGRSYGGGSSTFVYFDGGSSSSNSSSSSGSSSWDSGSSSSSNDSSYSGGGGDFGGGGGSSDW